ncbi:uncharacterized protein LOC144040265 [Vanacampus margaritifer]
MLVICWILERNTGTACSTSTQRSKAEVGQGGQRRQRSFFTTVPSAGWFGIQQPSAAMFPGVPTATVMFTSKLGNAKKREKNRRIFHIAATIYVMVLNRSEEMSEILVKTSHTHFQSRNSLLH